MECESAAARADMPGPGTEEWGAAPARGVKLPGELDVSIPTWFGVGICRTWGVPDVWFEGTGEASRAIEAALGTDPAEARPLLEPGDDANGTGRGREEDG